MLRLTDQKLSQVMFQKWIAMFSQPEIWMDWRRTNYPKRKPNTVTVISQIPRRYPTEQRERVNNLNAVIISDLENPSLVGQIIANNSYNY